MLYFFHQRENSFRICWLNRSKRLDFFRSKIKMTERTKTNSKRQRRFIFTILFVRYENYQMWCEFTMQNVHVTKWQIINQLLLLSLSIANFSSLLTDIATNFHCTDFGFQLLLHIVFVVVNHLPPYNCIFYSFFSFILSSDEKELATKKKNHYCCCTRIGLLVIFIANVKFADLQRQSIAMCNFHWNIFIFLLFQHYRQIVIA